MIELFVKGVWFGLGAALPIGPVNVEMARRALRSGFAPAFFLGVGAVTVDVVYATVSSLGVSPFLSSHSIFYWPLTLIAVGLLVFLGMMSLRGAREAARHDLLRTRQGNAARKANARAGGSSYLTGILMTGFSPFTIAFWFVVLPEWAGTISGQPSRDLPIIVTGVFVATLSWVVGFSTLLSSAGRWRKPWWLTAADEFGGAMLLALAGYAFLRSLHGFL